MGVSLAARKHPVLTTLRDTKAQVTPVGEVALSIPSGQPGRERGGNGLPKKPARAGKEREALALQGRFFWGDRLVKKQAYPRPDRQLLGFPISSKLPPVFGPSCMRQKLVPRTVRRPSPTPAVRVRLRSTNTKKIQFTQRLPLGSELHMGKERCCLRGLDHLHGPTFHSICGNFMIYKPSLTSDRLMFEHDESLRADLLPIHFPASYENGKLEHFLHRWMKNREHNNFWLTMFPEKRYFRERTSTTEVAIHTNLFTDLYASIGTGSSRTGGWYTTIIKLPFLFFIRIGFMLASLGGSRSLLRQLQKDKLRWN
ncbi:cytochrome c biogenesis CcmF C-terminal-like mitochondrial protein [Solanum dulcamara]|uniref:cytochrome c biogenesis CcmF C-terminal-like mitochondrial protein n=1 Tax=Solanum dulcamara TaxID=45834 RepID=UPI0024859E0E|nr:cytochrome c biogenesis CcmF C-terminal-like mitochondrial protein [Solanum dulcamara]